MRISTTRGLPVDVRLGDLADRYPAMRTSWPLPGLMRGSVNVARRERVLHGQLIAAG